LKIDTIWPEFLNIVREEVGSRVVETWFKAIVFSRWDQISKTAYLQVPNSFVKDWLLQNYLSLFENHLSRLLYEHPIRINFFEENQTHHAPATSAPITTSPATSSAISNTTAVARTQQKPPASNTKPAIIKPATHALAKTHPHRSRTSINHTYQFNTFVVGPHNSLAYAAAHAITEKPGKLYNPFFIYGESGLGKTHLLHAIGNTLREHDNKCRILYQSGDRFVNEFISAIRFNKIYHFENKYKDVDILLVDDIQFLSNKEQTQEAFFHIFNTLYQAQKQIVFTSDSLPRDIVGLADRMRSRLESGLIADITAPTLETKMAIIKKKAEMHHEFLDDTIVEHIASTVHSNVRELEGALIRVFAFASLTKQPLTLELAQKVLTRTRETKSTAIDLQKISATVAEHFDYSLQEIRSPKRDKDLTLARHIAIYLMKQHTQHSLREIGKFLERKDHSTILHALEKVEERKQSDPTFIQMLNQLEQQLMQ